MGEAINNKFDDAQIKLNQTGESKLERLEVETKNKVDNAIKTVNDFFRSMKSDDKEGIKTIQETNTTLGKKAQEALKTLENNIGLENIEIIKDDMRYDEIVNDKNILKGKNFDKDTMQAIMNKLAGLSNNMINYYNTINNPNRSFDSPSNTIELYNNFNKYNQEAVDYIKKYTNDDTDMAYIFKENQDQLKTMNDQIMKKLLNFVDVRVSGFTNSTKTYADVSEISKDYNIFIESYNNWGKSNLWKSLDALKKRPIDENTLNAINKKENTLKNNLQNTIQTKFNSVLSTYEAKLQAIPVVDQTSTETNPETIARYSKDINILNSILVSLNLETKAVEKHNTEHPTTQINITNFNSMIQSIDSQITLLGQKQELWRKERDLETKTVLNNKHKLLQNTLGYGEGGKIESVSSENKSGEVKPLTEIQKDNLNSYMTYMRDTNLGLEITGGATKTKFSEAAAQKVKSDCDQKFTILESNLKDSKGKISPEKQNFLNDLHTKYANNTQELGYEGNHYLARSRAMNRLVAMNANNLTKGINSKNLKITITPDAIKDTEENRAGRVNFNDVAGYETLGINHNFPDALFYSNSVEFNPTSNQQYNKNKGYINAVMSSNENAILLLEGFTALRNTNFGGEALNNWFENKFLTQEGTLSYIKPGLVDDFKREQSSGAMLGHIDFIDKYIDVEKIIASVDTDKIDVKIEEGHDKKSTIKELIRQVLLSVSRAEATKQDIVKYSLEKNPDSNISDRIYVVGYGTRENTGITQATTRKYLKSSYSLLDKKEMGL